MKMHLVSSIAVGCLQSDLLIELLIRLPHHCMFQLRPCLEFRNINDDEPDENLKNQVLSIYSSDEDFNFLDWYEGL